MSDFTRGRTFAPDEKLTPANLNQLIEGATVSAITLEELGAEFSSIFYGDADPGITYARVWYDTTSGAEGLKYAFVSPSNASIAGWLHATPRREAYYWVTTSVSLGTPLFLGDRTRLAAGSADLEPYDGLALIRAYQSSGDTAASHAYPALVVAMESRTGSGPLKCAWAGVIPAWTSESNVSQGLPLYVDNYDSARFRSDGAIAFDILGDAVAYWKMDAATGATRPDQIGTNHLADVGTLDVDRAVGLFDGAAGFGNVTTQKLRITDNADLSIGDVNATWLAWVRLNSVADNNIVFSKDAGVDGQREYRLFINSNRNPIFVVHDTGSGGGYTVHRATTFSLTTGNWHLIACEHDADNDLLRVSVDAGAFHDLAYSAGIFDGTSAFAVGLGENNIDPIDGRIDELALWKNRLLTIDELNTIYNSGSGQRLDAIRQNERLARGSIYGTVLHNHNNSVPGTLPGFLLWGTGPVIHDIKG